MRPGALARSRKQRGGCGCMAKTRKQRGGSWAKVVPKKQKTIKKRQQRQQQRRQQRQHQQQQQRQQQRQQQQQQRQQKGGAGYTFGLDDLSLGGKMPAVVTTACPKPLPGFYPPVQTGGAALVGSDISSMTQPIAGTTQLVNPALYNSSPAGIQFKMGLTSVFGPEKIPYPQVDSITARSTCSTPMTRRRNRNHWRSLIQDKLHDLRLTLNAICILRGKHEHVRSLSW